MLPCPFLVNYKFFAVNIYQYIAASNPEFVRVICGKYGYSLQNVQTTDDLGVCLEQVVAQEGEPAFREIVDEHPDKELILEMYASSPAQMQEKKCKCQGEKTSKVDQYLNAATGSTSSLQQGNLFIVAAALILAVAIISKK